MVALLRALPALESGQFIEIVLREEAQARDEQFRQGFSRCFPPWFCGGAVIYFALTMMFVRPMHDLTRSIEQFRNRPRMCRQSLPRSAALMNSAAPSRAADTAEQVRNAPNSASAWSAARRWRASGTTCATCFPLAQLVADRLGRSEDPMLACPAAVERTIDRAAGLAASTLKIRPRR